MTRGGGRNRNRDRDTQVLLWIIVVLGTLVVIQFCFLLNRQFYVSIPGLIVFQSDAPSASPTVSPSQTSEPSVAPGTPSGPRPPQIPLVEEKIFSDKEERVGVAFDIDKICQPNGKQILYAATYPSRQVPRQRELIVGEMSFNQDCSAQQVSAGQYQSIHFTTGTSSYLYCSGTVTYHGQSNVVEWVEDRESLERDCRPPSYKKHFERL